MASFGIRRKPAQPDGWGVPPSFPAEIEALFFIGPEPGGSREICNPPPTNTDADYHVLVRDMRRLETLLFNEGWEVGGSTWPGHGNWFFAYRKGPYNLIVTDKPEFYDTMVRSTAIAKRLNLLNKDDRIALFQAMRAHLPGGGS